MHTASQSAQNRNLELGHSVCPCEATVVHARSCRFSPRVKTDAISSRLAPQINARTSRIRTKWPEESTRARSFQDWPGRYRPGVPPLVDGQRHFGCGGHGRARTINAGRRAAAALREPFARQSLPDSERVNRRASTDQTLWSVSRPTAQGRAVVDRSPFCAWRDSSHCSTA